MTKEEYSWQDGAILLEEMRGEKEGWGQPRQPARGRRSELGMRPRVKPEDTETRVGGGSWEDVYGLGMHQLSLATQTQQRTGERQTENESKAEEMMIVIQGSKYQTKRKRERKEKQIQEWLPSALDHSCPNMRSPSFGSLLSPLPRLTDKIIFHYPPWIPFSALTEWPKVAPT